MEDLTFGEQVKIILGRKGMTIKQLAELIEVRTGKKMSRQNLTQRLGRDNFQEQDMRMIAKILDCPFYLNIMSEVPMQPRSTAALEQAAIARTEAVEEKMADEETEAAEITNEAAEKVQDTAEQAEPETVSGNPAGAEERDMTIGELYDIHEELSELEENAKAGESVEEIKKELEKPKKSLFHTGGIFLRKKNRDISAQDKNEASHSSEAAEQQAEKTEEIEPVISHNDPEEDREVGEVNPYTGREYQTNSVRMHPTRIGYVQVYDRTIHKWTDMTEWAFLGLQERKKALLGNAYEPPIYLD